MLGTGTQKIEDIVKNTFPDASIVRIDMDTSRTAFNLKKSISSFASGGVDILLGTQMIAKGLDFENATLVGIINADTGLFLPDFRSGERLFQLIYQTAGRSGRRKKPGEVIIQTYNPENPVIKHASSLDIESYYEMILDERNTLKYPPYSWLAKLEFSAKDKNSLNKITGKVYSYLNPAYKGLEILGPVDCYYEKLRNKYRMQIVLKSYKSVDPNGEKLNKYINNNMSNWNSKNYSDTKISIDINPTSLL
jgi:primosomal protein N' (replication factor Y)